jgi:hypothetical protein
VTQYPPPGQGPQGPQHQVPSSFGAPQQGQPTPPGYPPAPGYQVPQQPGYQAPQQPWGYPPPPGQQQPRAGKGRTIAIVAAVVVLGLVVGGFAAAQFLRPGQPVTAPTPAGSTSRPGQPTVPNVNAATSADAVRGYLEALAAGNAGAAIAYGQVTPPDTTFLTDAVLAEQRSRAAITEISVPALADPRASSVPASYRLGTSAVTATFAVRETGGTFKLRDSVATVDLTAARSPLVPMKLAGVTVTSGRVYLFPGVYPVTAGNRNFTYRSAAVTVRTPGSQSASGLTLTVSSAGTAAMVKAAGARLKSCLKKNEVRPKGCGFGVRVPTGVKLRTSSIDWRVSGSGSFKGIKPKLLSGGVGVAEAAKRIKIRFRAYDTRGGLWTGNANVSGVRATLFGSKVIASLY